MSVVERAKDLAEVAKEGRMSADNVQSLVAGAGLSIEQLMLDLIPLGKTWARPSVSGYKVGAVAQGDSGALYFGGNVEIGKCPVNQTVHAEQAVVVNAALHGETGLARLAVSAAPCGYCRQFLFELASADRLQILLAGRPPGNLGELLPGAFGPKDLGRGAGLLGPCGFGLHWRSAAPSATAEAARDAARRSYAPYTEAPAGVALLMRDGETVGGPYLENAAFNPSLSPAQTAVVAVILANRCGADVTEAALVQTEDSRIDHASGVRLILEGFAPGVILHEFRVCIS